jgi:hypothetical protein
VAQALFKYINGFYNARRRHSAIGGTSPIKFERNLVYTRTGCGTKTGQVQTIEKRRLQFRKQAA